MKEAAVAVAATVAAAKTVASGVDYLLRLIGRLVVFSAALYFILLLLCFRIPVFPSVKVLHFGKPDFLYQCC